MMTNEQRIQEIRNRLTQSLQPTFLEVIDDSAQHRGHAGAQSGAGHFTVRVAAPSLAGKSKVAAHQAIYKHLNDLIPDEIHALSIQIVN